MNSKNDGNADPKRFGTFLEDILRLGLESQGVSCHYVSCDTDGGDKLRIDVRVDFLPELPVVERYIKSQFIVDEKQSKMLRDHDGISPLEYRTRLGPSRSKLPEWSSFGNDAFSVTVDTAVAGALRRALQSLPKGAFGEDSLQKDRLMSLAARIEDAMAMLYLGEDLSLSGEPGFGDEALLTSMPAGEKANMEPSLEKVLQIENSPVVHEEKTPEAAPLAEAVLFFFGSNPGVLDKLRSVAAENGIELGRFEPEKAHADSSGFKKLVLLLDELGLRDFEPVSDFLSGRLNSWELLYQAVEIARLRGDLPSGETTVFDFALVLLKAQISPGLNS